MGNPFAPSEFAKLIKMDIYHACDGMEEATRPGGGGSFKIRASLEDLRSRVKDSFPPVDFPPIIDVPPLDDSGEGEHDTSACRDHCVETGDRSASAAPDAAADAGADEDKDPRAGNKRLARDAPKRWSCDEITSILGHLHSTSNSGKVIPKAAEIVYRSASDHWFIELLDLLEEIEDELDSLLAGLMKEHFGKWGQTKLAHAVRTIMQGVLEKCVERYREEVMALLERERSTIYTLEEDALGRAQELHYERLRKERIDLAWRNVHGASEARRDSATYLAYVRRMMAKKDPQDKCLSILAWSWAYYGLAARRLSDAVGLAWYHSARTRQALYAQVCSKMAEEGLDPDGELGYSRLLIPSALVETLPDAHGATNAQQVTISGW